MKNYQASKLPVTLPRVPLIAQLESEPSITMDEGSTMVTPDVATHANVRHKIKIPTCQEEVD